MPAEIHGIKTRVIRQMESRMESDRFGVDILTLVEEVPDTHFPGLMRAMGAVHPRYSSMAVSKRSAELGKGGAFWRVTYIFEGFLFSLPDATYELSGSLDQQPIQLHKEFASIAGTPAAPLNGAIFIDPDTGKITTDNTKAVFREFKATLPDGSPNPKGGVESFLDPAATWTATYFSTSRPSTLRSLGEIDSPDGANPSLSGRNWLLYDESYRQRGFVFEIRTTWKLSGRGGWDSDIY